MKSLAVDPICVFWTIVFPIALLIFFSVTIPSDNRYKYHPIQVALLNEQEGDLQLYHAMRLEKTYWKRPVFKVMLCSKTMCEKKLLNKEIDAYIDFQGDYLVVCNRENARTTLVKAYIEWYMQTGGKTQMHLGMNYLMEKAAREEFDKNQIYFLSLLALAAFLTFHWGIRIAHDMEGAQSKLAVHLMITPLSKSMLLLQNSLAVLLIELIVDVGLDLLTVLCRGLDLLVMLPQFLWVQILTNIVGCLSGMLWCNSKKGDRKSKHKRGELITFIMGFLAGIMFYNVRYIVEIKVPFLGKINPVSVATDALFHLYLIRDRKLYLQDITILVGMIAVLVALGIRVLRRRVYERL